MTHLPTPHPSSSQAVLQCTAVFDRIYISYLSPSGLSPCTLALQLPLSPLIGLGLCYSQSQNKKPRVIGYPK